ncbi:putative calcium-binding protein CML25 [Morella rubra]|uniref:Putative calcium-binding protein CML25 n=1 Tax=Morella rubra TaxID=262757 RepID=A0A6A1W3L7_9ROSI|nr:putative calcium-binding protein CML25 [Morella rubra]KAB1218937.1 putative calcium-binding protein CML25 [Morella rubra]
MLDSLGNCSTSFQSMKTFLRRLTAMCIMIGSQKRKSCRLSSKLELSTSHFASMEVSNQFKQVFKVIDANGDGRISTLELGEVLLCLGHEKSTALEEAERMVGEMDCNGDGLIDLDEFMDVMNTGGKAGVDAIEEDHLLDAFLIYDIDKNGLISPKELQLVLVSLGCEKCSLEECRRMIKAVDRDGDGFVGFEDFRSMMTASAY